MVLCANDGFSLYGKSFTIINKMRQALGGGEVGSIVRLHTDTSILYSNIKHNFSQAFYLPTLLFI